MSRTSFILAGVLWLYASPSWADTFFYVSTSGDGSAPTAGFAAGWNGGAWSDATHPIDWSAVHAALADGDVFLYFKRGDTFGRIRLFYWGGSYHSYDGSNRLHLTVAPGDSGPRPVFEKTSRTAWGVIVTGNAGHITFDNLELRSIFTDGDVDAGGISVNGTVPGWDNVARDALHFTNLSFANLRGGVALYFPGDDNVFENISCSRMGNCIYLINEARATTGGRAYIANVECHNINHDLAFVQTNGNPVDGHCVALQSVDECIVENINCTSSRTGLALWASRTISDQSLRRNVLRNSTIANSLHLDYVNSGTDNALTEGNLLYGNVFKNHPATTTSGYNRGSVVLAYLLPEMGKGDRLFHNTVYNSDGECFECWRNADGAIFKNNICDQAAATTVGFVDLYNGNAAGSNIRLEHNLYDDDRSDAWTAQSGASYDWSGWQSTAGQDVHSISPQDPRFENLGIADCELAADSPAVDRGDWLSHVTQAVQDSTTVTVADPYWFHGNYGMSRADGSPVAGMAVMLFDQTHGPQAREVLSVDHDSGTLQLNGAVTTLFNAGSTDDPAQTTQLALPFAGQKPDLGRYERGLGEPIQDGGQPADQGVLTDGTLADVVSRDAGGSDAMANDSGGATGDASLPDVTVADAAQGGADTQPAPAPPTGSGCGCQADSADGLLAGWWLVLGGARMGVRARRRRRCAVRHPGCQAQAV